MSRRVASTTFGLPSKRRTFWAVERPLGAACSSFTPLTASRHTWQAEHWDVLQDEATRAELKSGLPMFGTQFREGTPTAFRSRRDAARLPYLQGMPPSLQSLFRG